MLFSLLVICMDLENNTVGKPKGMSELLLIFILQCLIESFIIWREERNV